MRLVGLAAKSISSLQFTTNRECNRVETAVVEALTNIVKHAYKYSCDKKIETIIDICDNQICFTITDTGHSYNPNDIPYYDFDPQDLVNLPENGMGIHIYCSIMDEVHYFSRNGKNELTLIKYIS